MSTPPPSKPVDKPVDKPAESLTDSPADTAPKELPSWAKGMGVGAMILSVLVFLYILAFHIGAAVLSFQKFGSFLWAILDFFFPYFYYPYYAFVVSSQPAPVETGIVGGARRMMRRSRGRKGFATI